MWLVGRLGGIQLVASATAAALCLPACGTESGTAGQSGATEPRPVVSKTIHFDPGDRRARLALGGLAVRAWCDRRGADRRLRLIAITRLDDTSRASVLSGAAVGGETYAFRSGDFDRDDSPYDVIGSVGEGRLSGTFALARPDAGQVAVTFRADPSECRLRGGARFVH